MFLVAMLACQCFLWPFMSYSDGLLCKHGLQQQSHFWILLLNFKHQRNFDSDSLVADALK